MIEPTKEMRAAFMADHEDACGERGCGREDCLQVRLAAVLAIVERDHYVSRRPTPEQVASWPKPKRRLRACVEAWPECETDAYDPRCCRWPKSCSATVYDPEQVANEDLEPVA